VPLVKLLSLAKNASLLTAPGVQVAGGIGFAVEPAPKHRWNGTMLVVLLVVVVGIGMSGEFVVPVTYATPPESTEIPFPTSSPVPPK